MKVNEIKKTVEEIVRVEYVAEDGKVFKSAEECTKYEESALFAVRKSLKRLDCNNATIYSLIGEGSEECLVEIFHVQTEADLETLRRYLYLKMSRNNASERCINDCFTSESGARKEFVFDGVTAGHEVIIFWNYEEDWFWVYNDGSLEGYFDWVRTNYMKLTTPMEESK